jgi:hypothetical protein
LDVIVDDPISTWAKRIVVGSRVIVFDDIREIRQLAVEREAF